MSFESPTAHTEPIFIVNTTLTLFNIVLQERLIRFKSFKVVLQICNRLPTYIDNCIPVYGDSGHDLRKITFTYQ